MPVHTSHCCPSLGPMQVPRSVPQALNAQHASDSRAPGIQGTTKGRHKQAQQHGDPERRECKNRSGRGCLRRYLILGICVKSANTKLSHKTLQHCRFICKAAAYLTCHFSSKTLWSCNKLYAYLARHVVGRHVRTV